MGNIPSPKTTWTLQHLAKAMLQLLRDNLTTIAVGVVVAALLQHLLRPRRYWLDEDLEVFGTPRTTPRLGKVVICGGGCVFPPCWIPTSGACF